MKQNISVFFFFVVQNTRCGQNAKQLRGIGVIENKSIKGIAFGTGAVKDTTFWRPRRGKILLVWIFQVVLACPCGEHGARAR
jgi:hypothetical protein